MHANRYSKASGKIRKRGTRAATRERLLTATLELLHGVGETAISTVSVTRLAGIAQSAFYQHFANVDECLSVVAERVTNEIRTIVSNSRREMFESSAGDGKDIEIMMRCMFAMAEKERAINQLFLRYRSDPLALNGIMYRFGRGLVTDLAEQMTERAVQAGLRPGAKQMEALAEFMVGACWSAIEAFLDGRGPGVEESSRLLAVFLTNARRGVFDSLKTRKNARAR
jgi:AcrR family transcriptional regulator